MALEHNKSAKSRVRVHSFQHFGLALYEGDRMRASVVSLLTMALAFTMFAPNAHAIFKCQVAGQTVYQDKPCAAGTQSEIAVPVAPRYGAPPAPPTPAGSRVEGNKTWRVAPKSVAPFNPDLTEPQLGKYVEAATKTKSGKSEFESTADYQKRVAEPAGVKTFVVEPEFGSSRALAYDADRQVMRIDFGLVANADSPAADSSSTPSELRRKPMIWLRGGPSKTDTYIGENAFGAKRSVEKFVATSWGLSPRNLPAPRMLVIEEPMPTQQARDLKLSARWRIRGSLNGDGAKTWRIVEEPTISDPQDKRLTYYVAPAAIDRVELVDNKGVVIVAIEPIR